jgi:hypothetical protein
MTLSNKPGMHTHLDGEDHAHETGGQQRDAERARADQLQLLHSIAHVDFACATHWPQRFCGARTSTPAVPVRSSVRLLATQPDLS